MSDQREEPGHEPIEMFVSSLPDFSKGDQSSIYELNILGRAIRNYRLAWTVAVVAFVAMVYVGYFRGEWKPTGDGKTIVHSRTGEVRDVSDVRLGSDS
jgi:hypothetical protein